MVVRPEACPGLRVWFETHQGVASSEETTTVTGPVLTGTTIVILTTMIYDVFYHIFESYRVIPAHITTYFDILGQ